MRSQIQCAAFWILLVQVPLTTSRQVPRALPHYDYTLTYIMDGAPAVVIDNSSSIAEHHQLAGRSMAEAIAEGKRATLWLKEKYGIDFTDVEDEVYLDGSKAVTRNNLTFKAFALDPRARYRLVTASNGYSAQYFNIPLTDAGWTLITDEEYQANGSYTGVIPKNSYILYSDYVIPVCPYCRTREGFLHFPCGNIFGTTTPLVIHYETKSFLALGNPIIIDFLVRERTWGEGEASAVGWFSGTNNKIMERTVLTFPGTFTENTT
ncbi:uncharacterized protein LOC106174869 [Lingula anatina]|uniref:Uncharacterized protein LOC106174869 n=1 Tax=Lingula anatina TaxID=7574 RepID=A0A1S3JPL1_LINAN|nr:uncharacterized protein LOC106174869 [Lingula anatina]XP_013412071.1 uncharacterized protein LOC106174869 [Lingula anatina]|eukprot:XP_013412062.1 uncharacterized protein LOC106174869 [Lingula anatina]